MPKSTSKSTPRRRPSPPREPTLEVVSINELTTDPANPRFHPEFNKKAVLGSVKRFGPARSIVIDEGGVVLCGNETANACASAGFAEVLIVTPAPGQLVAVRRTGLTETEKTGLAIADNQTATSAGWVPELPDAIRSLKLDGFELDSLGFTDAQLTRYLEGDMTPDPEEGGGASEGPAMCKCPKCGEVFPR